MYVKHANDWILTQVISQKGRADHFSGFRIRAFDRWLFVAAIGTPIGPVGDDTVLDQNFTGSIQISKRNYAGLYEFAQAIDRTTPGLENLSSVNPLFFDQVSPPLRSIELGGVFGITFDFSQDNEYLIVGAPCQQGTDSNSQPLLNAGEVFSF